MEITSGRFSKSLLDKYPSIKLMAKYSHFHVDQAVLFLAGLLHHTGASASHTPSDALHTSSILFKSYMARILKQKVVNRPRPLISGPNFRTAVLYWTGLPPRLTHGNADRHPGHDSDLEVCRSCPSGPNGQRKVLDPTGDHAASCLGAYNARLHAHHAVAQVLVQAAREAGVLQAIGGFTGEPKTHLLLNGVYGPKLCAAMFPLASDPHSIQIAKQIRELAQIAHDCRTPLDFRQQAKRKLDVMLAAKDDLLGGLRIDVYLQGIDGRELFIDVTGLCITAASHLKGEIRHAAWADASRRAASINRHPDPMARTERPAFAKRQQDKLKKYAPLVDIATFQVGQGYRAHAPKFKTVAFSRCASLSKGLFETVDWIANQFGLADQQLSQRLDSRSTGEVRAEFRADVLDRLVCAIVQGSANIMRAAGHTKGACSTYSNRSQ